MDYLAKHPMKNLTVLLPYAILEQVGVSLLDFFRQILLASKRSLKENLSYPLYPISREDDDPQLMMKDSTKVARYTEHRLARFTVLEEEHDLMRLYKKFIQDMNRSSFPANFNKLSFHDKYLAKNTFVLLSQAIDVLFWYSVLGTSRTLTAKDGLEILRKLFRGRQWEDGETEEKIMDANLGCQHAELYLRFETNLKLTAMPFRCDRDYAVLYDSDAPVESRNTLFFRFSDNPPEASIRVYIPSEEAGVIERSNSERDALVAFILKVFSERFNRKSLWKMNVREAEPAKNV